MGFGVSPPVEEGEKYDVEIEKVGKEGDGVAKIKDFVVFIPNTTIGDKVRIEITRVLRTMAFGEVIEKLDKENENLREKAKRAFNKAKEETIKTKEFTTKVADLKDKLIEAKTNYERENYRKVIELSKALIVKARKNFSTKPQESVQEIEEEINSLEEEEKRIDTREIMGALQDGKVEKAEELLEGLKEKYQEYKETIEELEELDVRKSSLAEKLADDEIDRQTFNDAREDIEHKKAKLEEKLNKLRQEVIHEDYEKPF